MKDLVVYLIPETTLFTKHVNDDILIIQIYVGDIIFDSTNENLCKYFELCMKKEFEMSMMGELNYFLGLQIKQRSDGIFVNQAKYTKDLIKKFELENVKVSRTPMATTIELDKDEQNKNVDSKLYHNIIGSLLYLTTSKSDIMFSVFVCAGFQSCPKESHLSVIKCIIKYFKVTIGMGFWFSKTGQFNMMGYLNADYVGSRVERKSTSGTCQFLENCIILWSFNKQNFVALLTVEAANAAAAACCA